MTHEHHDLSQSELRDLAQKTSHNIVSTIAKVTFYGTDQSGNVVTATGSLGIAFGNFADPK